MRWNQCGNTTGRTPAASERLLISTSAYSAKSGDAASAAPASAAHAGGRARSFLRPRRVLPRRVVAARALGERRRHRAVAHAALLALQDRGHAGAVRADLGLEDVLVAVRAVEPHCASGAESARSAAAAQLSRMSSSRRRTGASALSARGAILPSFSARRVDLVAGAVARQGRQRLPRLLQHAARARRIVHLVAGEAASTGPRSRWRGSTGSLRGRGAMPDYPGI